MDCPNCKCPMIILEFDMIELDNCPACGGVWLDAGELELLTDSTGGVRELLPAGSGSSRANFKCPICRVRMRQIDISGNDKQVAIDECPKGHGLWLDKNELQTLIESAGLQIDPKLKSLLSEVFSKPI